MKSILASLVVLLSVSTASAWTYTPIEQSWPQQAYRVPYYRYGAPARPYYGRYYGGPQPLRIHEMYNTQTGQVWQGFSY